MNECLGDCTFGGMWWYLTVALLLTHPQPPSLKIIDIFYQKLCSRCVRCNGDILEIEKDDVEGRDRLRECGIVPPNILAGTVFQCVSCLQVSECQLTRRLLSPLYNII